MTIIISDPGKGLQRVHYDIKDYNTASKCYSCIMYCKHGDSTAVPSTPLAELRELIYMLVKEKHHQIEITIIRPERFIIKSVEPGEILVFQSNVPHYGVTNYTDSERVVIFSLFYPATIENHRPKLNVIH